MDYTKKYGQKLVTLTMKNGDKFNILSLYDDDGKFWYSTIDNLRVSIYPFRSEITKKYPFYSDIIENCISANVEHFSFQDINYYSNGEVCNKTVFKRVC